MIIEEIKRCIVEMRNPVFNVKDVDVVPHVEESDAFIFRALIISNKNNQDAFYFAVAFYADINSDEFLSDMKKKIDKEVAKREWT